VAKKSPAGKKVEAEKANKKNPPERSLHANFGLTSCPKSDYAAPFSSSSTSAGLHGAGHA